MSEKFKLDVPIDLSEKTTNKLELTKRILHLITIFTTFLTICIDAPLIATEVKYEGAGAPGPNYTLFVAIISIFIPFALVYFPWMYDNHNKFRRGGKFFMKPRTNIIFCGFNSFLWLTAGAAINSHANNAATCSINPALQEIYGDSYTSAWSTGCNLAKVTTAFAWITFILWLGTLIITGIHFWKERSIIQQRLNEHRTNKLEEIRKQQEDEESNILSPYPFELQKPQQQSPLLNSVMNELNSNSNLPGQYATPVFSPMPTPQHHQHQHHYNY